MLLPSTGFPDLPDKLGVGIKCSQAFCPLFTMCLLWHNYVSWKLGLCIFSVQHRNWHTVIWWMNDGHQSGMLQKEILQWQKSGPHNSQASSNFPPTWLWCNLRFMLAFLVVRIYVKLWSPRASIPFSLTIFYTCKIDLIHCKASRLKGIHLT